MSDKPITLSEFLYKCISLNEIIYYSEFEQCCGCAIRGNELDSEVATLSECLYKCISLNEIIYYSELEQCCGRAIRGNEWDSEVAKKYYVIRVYVNNIGKLQVVVFPIPEYLDLLN